jgi:hypothetical protein
MLQEILDWLSSTFRIFRDGTGKPPPDNCPWLQRMGVRRATGRTLGFTLEFMHVPALDRERETPANRKSRVLRQKTSPEKMRKIELSGPGSPIANPLQITGAALFVWGVVYSRFRRRLRSERAQIARLKDDLKYREEKEETFRTQAQQSSRVQWLGNINSPVLDQSRFLSCSVFSSCRQNRR